MSEQEKERFIEPLYDRVVMTVIKNEKTRQGIILPETAQDAQRAKVVAVGPGKYDIEKREYLPLPLAVGDVVFINPHLGNRMKLELNGTEYLLQREDEILGKETYRDAE